MNEPVKLPQSLTTNPRLDRWIKFEDDKTVRVASGKVEIGQGIVTALAQIAAEELDVPLVDITLGKAPVVSSWTSCSGVTAWPTASNCDPPRTAWPGCRAVT